MKREIHSGPNPFDACAVVVNHGQGVPKFRKHQRANPPQKKNKTKKNTATARLDDNWLHSTAPQNPKATWTEAVSHHGDGPKRVRTSRLGTTAPFGERQVEIFLRVPRRNRLVSLSLASLDNSQQRGTRKKKKKKKKKKNKRDIYGCGSKNRYSEMGCPGKWKPGPKPAVCPPLFNFEPHPYPAEGFKPKPKGPKCQAGRFVRPFGAGAFSLASEAEVQYPQVCLAFGGGSKPMGSHFGVGAPPGTGF